MSDCIIYALSIDGHEYRYVGLTTIGDLARLRKHCADAKAGWTRPVHDWIREHGDERIGVYVLEDVGTAELLPRREEYWIDRLRDEGHDLLNCYRSGRVVTDQQRERARVANKRRFEDPAERERVAERTRQLWRDPDYAARVKANRTWDHTAATEARKRNAAARRAAKDLE